MVCIVPHCCQQRRSLFYTQHMSSFQWLTLKSIINCNKALRDTPGCLIVCCFVGVLCSFVSPGSTWSPYPVLQLGIFSQYSQLMGWHWKSCLQRHGSSATRFSGLGIKPLPGSQWYKCFSAKVGSKHWRNDCVLQLKPQPKGRFKYYIYISLELICYI